jgi:hypothetical protein
LSSMLGKRTHPLRRGREEFFQHHFASQAELSTASALCTEKGIVSLPESRGVVVVDSFRTVVRNATGGTTEVELQSFIQRLALLLTSWQATTFLVGEYVEVRSVTILFSRSPMASFGFTRLRSEIPLCGSYRS